MSNNIKKAIITAAGFGSRFLPITKSIPKEMLPILDKPIMHFIVEECAEAGIEEIIVVAAPDEVRFFEDYFYGHSENIRMLMQLQGKMDRWDKVKKIFELPKVTIIPEDRTMAYGNGRPILTAKRFLEEGESFVMCFGDDLTIAKPSGVKQVLDFYYANECDAVMQVVDNLPVEHLTKGGVIKLKEGTTNQVDWLIEKPSIDNLPSNLYSFGRMVLPYKIFDYLNPDMIGKDGEIWLQEANDKLAHDYKVLVQILDGQFLTTGDPLAYIKAQIEFFLADEKLGEQVRAYLETRIKK